MYNHIRGILTAKSPSRVVVEAEGVGYDMTIPVSAFRKMPDIGQNALVLVHLVVREDEMRLIGFATEDERDLFRRLIGLSGVGPSMALQILSGMTPQEFILAIERQDSEALKRIKGVGDKTAKRIIIELKGAKMVLPQESGKMPEGPTGEAVAALIALGLSQNEAGARVEKVLAKSPDLSIEDLIKAALR